MERGLKIKNKKAKKAQISPILTEAILHDQIAPIQEEIKRQFDFQKVLYPRRGAIIFPLLRSDTSSAI